MAVRPLILIIEDEVAIADAVQYALQAEQFDTLWVSVGREGVAALAKKPDLIILDVGLPDTTGFELIKQIRPLSAVPVLFLTARADEIDRVLGLELGADDYVLKPFSPRELVARVKAILKRSRPVVMAEPVVGGMEKRGFVVEAAAARCWLNGQPLDLTPNEYRLLSTLLGAPQRILSRAQLLDALQDSDAFERTIDSHIKALRGKLHALDPTCEAIQTHRGFGYSFAWPRLSGKAP